MSEAPDRRLVTRRAAARAIAAGTLAAFAAPRALAARAPRALTPPGAAEQSSSRLRLGIVRAAGGDESSSAMTSGIRLGADEASRSATLLRKTLDLHEGDVDGLLERGVDVLLGGTSSNAALATAERASVVWLDLSGDDDRPGATHRFRVAPGAATRRLAAARAATTGDVVAWHPSLERFGAGQLNARFASRFGEPMTSPAWAGWVAVKIAWESFLRRDDARGETLAAFLLSPRARFDGHKGRALHFDPATRELMQPLYVVSGSGDGPPSIEEVAPPDTARPGDSP